MRINTSCIVFHTTFYFENDALKCRIKDPYDEILHKIPAEWSHDILHRDCSSASCLPPTDSVRAFGSLFVLIRISVRGTEKCASGGKLKQ